MKSLLRAASWCALLLVCLPNSASAFAPAHCDFTVDLPQPAHEEVTKFGGHIYSAEHDGNGYVASCSDLSQRVKVTKANVEEFLDRARDGATDGATLISERKMSIEGHPARDLRIKTGDGYFMRLRLIMSGSRLYQVGFVTQPDKADMPEIETYLNSFHLSRH